MKTKQKGFVVDLNRCTGCNACELACQIENGLSFEISWRTVHTLNEARSPAAPVVHLSLACNHCREPACMIHCPALAYSKDERTGAVIVHEDRCIGCRYCSWVCPYDAPRFDEAGGVMRKCTFCNERLHEGLEPACVAYCPTDALGTREFDGDGDPDGGALPEGFPRTALGPAIEFVPLRPGLVPPVAEPCGPSSRPEGGRSKITIRSEWTLLVFTMIAPVLVGSFAARALGEATLPGMVHVLLGLVGMGLSTLHLGKPTRAWRAMLNLRRSWLSREIVAFSGFFGASALVALGVELGALAGLVTGIAIALGAVALLSMDQVYRVAATTRSTASHSASTLLTGILFFGILGDVLPVALGALAMKGALYLARKRRPGAVRGYRAGLAALRLGVGVALPLGLLALSGVSGWLLFALCLAGELIDRLELYDELTIVTPGR